MSAIAEAGNASSTARSPIETMPTTRRPSTTGSRRTSAACIRRTALSTVSSGDTASTSPLHRSATVSAVRSLPSATPRSTISRSVTMPRTLPPSTTTTGPMSRSRMIRATSTTGVSPDAVTGSRVITSEIEVAIAPSFGYVPSGVPSSGPAETKADAVGAAAIPWAGLTGVTHLEAAQRRSKRNGPRAGTNRRVLFPASVQDERHLQMDAEAGDLPITHHHLLLFDPRPLDVAHGLACLRDCVANRGLEALAAGRCQLDRLGNAHGVSSS